MAEIETLTAEEREGLFWREELGDEAREKALRIIDAQAARIADVQAQLIEARELIARAYIQFRGTTLSRELAQFLSRVDASGRRSNPA
jgi:hypothetical protein